MKRVVTFKIDARVIPKRPGLKPGWTTIEAYQVIECIGAASVGAEVRVRCEGQEYFIGQDAWNNCTIDWDERSATVS